MHPDLLSSVDSNTELVEDELHKTKCYWLWNFDIIGFAIFSRQQHKLTEDKLHKTYLTINMKLWHSDTTRSAIFSRQQHKLFEDKLHKDDQTISTTKLWYN